MTYYLFTLFDTSHYISKEKLPRIDTIPFGTFGYNTIERQWAKVVIAPLYKVRDKQGNIRTYDRKWQVIPEDQAPADCRTQILLLGA